MSEQICNCMILASLHLLLCVPSKAAEADGEIKGDQRGSVCCQESLSNLRHTEPHRIQGSLQAGGMVCGKTEKQESLWERTQRTRGQEVSSGLVT